jgi:hypothetical protein
VQDHGPSAEIGSAMSVTRRSDASLDNVLFVVALETPTDTERYWSIVEVAAQYDPTSEVTSQPNRGPHTLAHV